MLLARVSVPYIGIVQTTNYSYIWYPYARQPARCCVRLLTLLAPPNHKPVSLTRLRQVLRV